MNIQTRYFAHSQARPPGLVCHSNSSCFGWEPWRRAKGFFLALARAWEGCVGGFWEGCVGGPNPLYLSPRMVLDNLGVIAQPCNLSTWGGRVRKQKFKVILLCSKSKAILGWFAFHSPSSCARTLKQVSSGGFEISPTQRMFIASLWPRRSAVSLLERPTKSEWHGGYLSPYAS